MDRSAKVVEFLEKTPVLYRPALERAFIGKASPRGAIKAMCLSCACFVREEITHCQVTLCPLHAYRPYQLPAASTQGS
jgi:hypothetical protein